MNRMTSKLCPVCNTVTIQVDKDKCQDCGGEVTNCLTCGTGKKWWYDSNQTKSGHYCLNCESDPLILNAGRSDHKEFGRAKMISMYGPRMDGDRGILDKYREELTAKHWLKQGRKL